MMEYKGCIGQVEFDEDAGIIRSEVINTRDVITFQGNNVARVKKAFLESVDDYLEFCRRGARLRTSLFLDSSSLASRLNCTSRSISRRCFPAGA